MPSIDPIQTSFAGGEVSPRLGGRVDTDLYRRALAYCLNMEPQPQGSLLMRGGTRFVAEIGGDARTRLIPFRVAAGQDYVIALTDELLEIYTSGGPLLGGALSELVVNGGFSPAGASWTVAAGSPAFLGGKVVLMDGDSITQAATAAAGTTDIQIGYRVLAINNITGAEPFFAEPRVRVTQGVTTLYSGRPSASGDVTITVAAAPGALTIQLDNLAGAAGTSWEVTNVTVKAGNAAAVSLVTPWTASQLSEVQFASMPAVDAMVLVHPNVEPQVLARDATTGVWSLTDISGMSGFAGWPAYWTGTNWPGAVEVWQSRLYLGGSPNERNRIVSSRVGALYDFRTATGAGPTTLASDGLDIIVSTKGGIAWMHGQRMLIVGTDLGEFQLTSSTGAVTPLDFQVSPQSAYGAAARQSVAAGEQILYLSRDGRKVRACNFANAEQSWVAKDLTFPAEHITSGIAAEINHARDPNGTIILTLQSGNLVCCTYDRSEQIVGWWRLTTGTVLSACVTNGANGSELFLCVERSGGNYLEVLPMVETSDRVYLDCSLVLDVPAGAAPVVTGLSHLEGETVGIVLDGALEENQVVTGGQVTLARAGTQVVVGLRYTAMAKTLKPEGGNPSGTAQAAKRRWAKIVARLNNSAIPLINGRRAADRSPSTALDTAEPARDFDVEVSGAGSWEDSGVITITQDIPLRTEILALFGTLAVHKV